MREVFGERDQAHITAARAIKPTEVGGVAKERNHDKESANKGWFPIRGCPRRGDGCGDRVNEPQNEACP